MAQEALPPDIAKLSFEDALAELEKIVRTLEDGRGKLEDSIKAYERGDWEEVHAAGRDEQVFDAYFAALAQAHETLEQIGTSH